jgi:hypothetical protein
MRLEGWPRTTAVPETPSFAALWWAPPAITAKPLRGDEVREFESIGFMESIV